MPSVEARVRTERASRYLAQLCRHTSQVSVLAHGNSHEAGAASATPRRAEYSETDGVVDFDRGHCTLRATPEELILLVEADDEQDLRLLQDALATRVQQIGRRDQLSVTWRVSAEPGHRDRDAAAILAQL